MEKETMFDREMMLEKDLWLRQFVDEAIKALDENLNKKKQEGKKKEAA